MKLAVDGLVEKNMVNLFRQSAPYINAHRGKTFVLMLSGEAIEHDNFINTVHDIALLNSLGVHLVLAVGARPQIEKQIALEGLNAKFHQGLRVTDKNILEVVKRVTGQVRVDVEASLSTGIVNSPMQGASVRVVSGNFIQAKPIGVRDGVDFCFTGEVRKIDKKAIKNLLYQNEQMDAIVLLPCLGYSSSGEVFSLSVEDVATQAALALRADKLIAFTDEVGITNPQGDLLKELRPTDCAELLNQEGLTQACRQSLRACYNAIDQGIPRAHVISYCENGSLLSELYTRDGGGTLITMGSFEQVREAQLDDVGGILELLQPLEEAGVLVRRSRELLENEIEKFTVIERDGMVVACIALYPYSVSEGNNKSAEIACIATHEYYKGAKRASILLEYVERKAREENIELLFVLTTQTAHWFLEHGFLESDLETLPDEKKRFYNFQRNSKVFVKNIAES